MFESCGYTIDFKYFNYASNPLPVGHDALAKAGVECILEDSDGNRYYGDSYCSVNDDFDQTYGEEIALNRAMNSLGLDDDIKNELWNAYDTWVRGE